MFIPGEVCVIGWFKDVFQHLILFVKSIVFFINLDNYVV